MPSQFKTIGVSKVPKAVVDAIRRDAEREHLSDSDIIRRILLEHYGLMNNHKNDHGKPG